MEFETLRYSTQEALRNWGVVAGSLGLAAVVLSFLLTMLRFGPRGASVFSRGLTSYVSDMLSMSPTRVLAVARLTLKEAIRRKALMVFVVFALLLMFAGWFMSSGNSRATISVGVQIWFLLTAISWLVLPAVMFLSCWSIPEEIRVRSLHTVVTKPIRRIEVVLGRMVGFGAVVTVVVGIMGASGYIWIQRQVPDSARDMLTCRVPVYGTLFFRDREGLLATEGVNTGDVWAYRSYVEGNSQARAIWQFFNITPDMFKQGPPGSETYDIRLESRFEAFRTVKGSEESIENGIQGQFTLRRDLRDRAFSVYRLTPAFRDFGRELVDGQFRNASRSIRQYADSIVDGSSAVEANDFLGYVNATRGAYLTIGLLGENFEGVQDAFSESGKAAASVRSPTDTTAIENFSKTLIGVADAIEERADDLLEAMPRLEVPLPPFNVTEYHTGQDQYVINRELSFNADYESLARYLASTVAEWNEAARFVTDGQLVDGLAEKLANETDISGLNSELLLTVLQEDIDAGVLTLSDDRMKVADERSWLNYFDQMVRAERLISQDPMGWVLTADLYEDLLLDGSLTVEVACLDSQMFIGMARPDLFIRLPDNPFIVGYSKALLSTVLMLLLVVVIGVTASCIVKGPVALFLTFGVFLIGQMFHQFMIDIVAGRVEGSGLIESSVLILQQRNPGVGVNVSANAGTIIESADKVTSALLQGASQIVPNFSLFSQSADYIESGFDVPWITLMVPVILTFVGFLIPCVLLGAAFLKFRELEAK